MSDGTNGFGYVEVKDDRVICYTGESDKPDIHIFENDEIVQAVRLRELVEELGKTGEIEGNEEMFCVGKDCCSGIISKALLSKAKGDKE